MVMLMTWLAAFLAVPAALAQPAAAPAHAAPARPAAAEPGPAPATIRIVSPEPLYLVGRARVRAEVVDSAGQPVTRIAFMTLSVDGRAMAPDSRAPFEWEFDAGGDLDRHRLELAAVDKDGARTTLSVLSSTHAFVEAVGVNLVLVPAVVREGGRALSGLTRDDFTVLEDGVPQTLTSFSAEPLPASIAIALDNSQSMEGQLWSAQKAIAEFVDGQPAYSAFAFLTFNDQVFLEQDFTHDAGLLDGAVAAARVEGSRTALFDALRVGSMYLGKRPGARVLLVFTDGEDTVYEGDEGRLRTSIDAAQAADVTVFAVAYAGAATGGGRGAGALGQMTSQTGGEVAPARSAKELRAAFARIAESIGSRYLLGYEPPQPKKPGYRSIEVRVSRSGAEVLSRRGYQMR